MAFRGRGRGRGWGPRNFHGKQEPYILFPEDVELPPTPKLEMTELIRRKARLEKFWKFSPYYIQDKSTTSNSQCAEIERYSDRNKPQMNKKREPLSYYIKLTSTYFPVELLQGSKRVKHNVRNLQWDNNETGLKKLDLFEKLEDKYQDQDKKPEKKDGENEDEEDEDKMEEEEEESDGDYYQNVDFDDDEDDLNMEEEDEGPTYD